MAESSGVAHFEISSFSFKLQILTWDRTVSKIGALASDASEVAAAYHHSMVTIASLCQARPGAGVTLDGSIAFLNLFAAAAV